MVPIVPTPHDAVRLFAQVVSTRLVAEHPRLATMETHKARRGRRIYLDARQNGSGKTIASVYSVRPVPGGRVSTPVTWDEMSTGVDPSQFTMSTVPERIDRMQRQKPSIAGTGTTEPDPSFLEGGPVVGGQRNIVRHGDVMPCKRGLGKVTNDLVLRIAVKTRPAYRLSHE